VDIELLIISHNATLLLNNLHNTHVILLQVSHKNTNIYFTSKFWGKKLNGTVSHTHVVSFMMIAKEFKEFKGTVDFYFGLLFKGRIELVPEKWKPVSFFSTDTTFIASL